MVLRRAATSTSPLIDEVFGMYSFNDETLQKSVPKFAYVEEKRSEG